MANLLKLTLSDKAARQSKITGEFLENIEYSKLGHNPFGPQKTQIQNQTIGNIERISAESLRLIKEDWKNICLDFTQLGLTVVGLIEVAEPIQIAADVTNGSIDIARGHPYIGALSMISAIPVAGLLAGIPLTLIRAFKCVWGGLKCLGRCFVVLTVKSVAVTAKFIYLRKGIVLNFVQKTGTFIQNTGNMISKGLPEITDKILKNIKDFGEQMAQKASTPVNISSTSVSSKTLSKQLAKPINQAKAAHEGRRNVQVYGMFPNSNGAMSPLSNVFRGPKL